MSTVRNLSATALGRISAREVRPAVFLYAGLPSGDRRVWTGPGPVEWGGHTWEGVGEVLALEGLGEDADTYARGITLRLAGMDPDLAAEIAGQPYSGSPCAVYIGFFDPGTGGGLEVVEAPLFEGILDSDDMEDSGDAADLTLRAEHRLVDVLRQRSWRYTQGDQDALRQSGDPADTGLRHMPGLQDLQMPWGRADR